MKLTEKLTAAIEATQDACNLIAALDATEAFAALGVSVGEKEEKK